MRGNLPHKYHTWTSSVLAVSVLVSSRTSRSSSLSSSSSSVSWLFLSLSAVVVGDLLTDWLCQRQCTNNTNLYQQKDPATSNLMLLYHLLGHTETLGKISFHWPQLKLWLMTFDSVIYFYKWVKRWSWSWDWNQSSIKTHTHDQAWPGQHSNSTCIRLYNLR